MASQFVQRGSQAATRGIAEAAGIGRRGDNLGNKVVQRRRIGLDIGVEGKLFAATHDGNAVIAHSAGNQDLVAWFAVGAGKAYAFGDEADAAGVDEHAIAMAAVNHLGIAGNDVHAGFLRHFGHAFADALQIGDGIALFQDEAAA